MMVCHAVCSKKAQMKIQQMAFILVAIIIFFVMVGLLYLSISLSGMRKGVQDLKEEEARVRVLKIWSSAEFIALQKDCSNCIDLDKVMILKSRKAYDEFFQFNFLQLKRVYPKMNDVECDISNYPNCDKITLVKNENIGTPSAAYISFCYWTEEKGGYVRCDLGRIYASGSALVN